MGYINFTTAIYCPVNNLIDIASDKDLEEGLSFFTHHVHVDKVYLETYRSGHFITKDKMVSIMSFFRDRGITTSGGITPSGEDTNENPGFMSMCYANQEHRDRLADVSRMTASLFDEIILDDFYFYNCRCALCQEAKGDRTWSAYRLATMEDVSRTCVLEPARATNPNVKVIIKYPNWHDCYAETGYHLAVQPEMFDAVYTGTETRDARYTQQNLPKYLSYFMMRYMEQVKPGANDGGWFDAFECMANLNDYRAQADLTLYAKPREVTLFCWGLLLRPFEQIFVPIAAHSFSKIDAILGKLGHPIGTPLYLPYGAENEKYLGSYLGMVGLALEPQPTYPETSDHLILTAGAAQDRDIIKKVIASLNRGADVVVTSGFIAAVGEEAFEPLAKIKMTGQRAKVNRFALINDDLNVGTIEMAAHEILLPRVTYATNDAWPLAMGLENKNSTPVLLGINYGKGHLIILTIPDDFGDLNHYPPRVLSRLRKLAGMPGGVRLMSGANVCLFCYDNATFILQSFLDNKAMVKVEVDGTNIELAELFTHARYSGWSDKEKTRFEIEMAGSAYMAFQIIKM